MEQLMAVVLIISLVTTIYLLLLRRSHQQRWSHNHRAFMQVMSLVVQHCPGGSHHDVIETRRSKPLCRWLWTWQSGSIKVELNDRERQLVLTIGQDQVRLKQVASAEIAAGMFASQILHVELPADSDTMALDVEPDDDLPSHQVSA